MPEFILETAIDTGKALPILFLVYLLIEIIQKKLDAEKLLNYRNSLIGPPAGALAGCIPQCGFSAASATLYNSGAIGAGTLIAVFLSTSDEALPIMLSRSAPIALMVSLILWKIVIAVLSGYLMMFTVFRNEQQVIRTHTGELMDCDEHCHEHHSSSMLKNACSHTIKTTLFIGVTLLIINAVIFLIGEQRLENLLLSDSVFQPFFTALIGLVPGCATSVFLIQLLLSGSISFGAAVAGLSTGAGFGFLILFKGNKNKKNCFKILACTYLCGAVAGMLLELL